MCVCRNLDICKWNEDAKQCSYCTINKNTLECKWTTTNPVAGKYSYPEDKIEYQPVDIIVPTNKCEKQKWNHKTDHKTLISILIRNLFLNRCDRKLKERFVVTRMRLSTLWNFRIFPSHLPCLASTLKKTFLILGKHFYFEMFCMIQVDHKKMFCVICLFYFSLAFRTLTISSTLFKSNPLMYKKSSPVFCISTDCNKYSKCIFCW